MIFFFEWQLSDCTPIINNFQLWKKGEPFPTILLAALAQPLVIRIALLLTNWSFTSISSEPSSRAGLPILRMSSSTRYTPSYRSTWSTIAVPSIPAITGWSPRISNDESSYWPLFAPHCCGFGCRHDRNEIYRIHHLIRYWAGIRMNTQSRWRFARHEPSTQQWRCEMWRLSVIDNSS
jgi:hypothetical protein